jgi:IS1 family transposase
MVVNKNLKKIICLSFGNGKKHDFRLLKESKTRIHPETKVLTDTGYQGFQKLHAKTSMPKKKTKKNSLEKTDKLNNQKLARERVLNENVIGVVKRFKVLSERYRNRRKRFCLRFNLIAGIYNLELE